MFGFAVAVHPRESGHRVVRAGGEGRDAACRSTGAWWWRARATAARSFETLRKGLPQEHAYDLVYRHGLDVDDSGDRLAMGSTTGGLWLSEDQGERWQAPECRLPPIHALTYV